MKNFLLVFCLIVLGGKFSWCQLPSINLMGQKDKIRLPFTYYYNFVLVEAKINGLIPVTLIFDTGAENSILFDKLLAQSAGATLGRRVILMGSDQSTQIEASVSRQLAFYFPKLGLTNMDVIVLDDDIYNMQEITGRVIHGVLGANFFKGMILKIDYRRKYIEISRPELFEKPNSDWQEIPMHLIQEKPHIKVATAIDGNETVDLLYLLDSGAGINTLIHNNSHENIQVPEEHITGHLGSGLGGPLQGYVGRLRYLNIGPYRLNNIISGFQQLDSARLYDDTFVRNGLFGNPILRKFKIIMDFARENIYLKPSKYFDDDIGVDRSGALWYAAGVQHNKYYVRSILPDSPADEAGLKEGDQLIRIKGWPAGWFHLSRIVRKFQDKAGRKIRITIRRDGQKLNKTIILDDII